MQQTGDEFAIFFFCAISHSYKLSPLNKATNSFLKEFSDSSTITGDKLSMNSDFDLR